MAFGGVFPLPMYLNIFPDEFFFSMYLVQRLCSWERIGMSKAKFLFTLYTTTLLRKPAILRI